MITFKLYPFIWFLFCATLGVYVGQGLYVAVSHAITTVLTVAAASVCHKILEGTFNEDTE